MTISYKATNAINWITALLSGDYKQGKHRLGSLEKGFCCWGLGCYLILSENDWGKLDAWNTDLGEHFGFRDINGILKNPVNMVNKRLYYLSEVNDCGKFDFNFIGKHLIKHAIDEFEIGVGELIQEHFAPFYLGI